MSCRFIVDDGEENAPQWPRSSKARELGPGIARWRGNPDPEERWLAAGNTNEGLAGEIIPRLVRDHPPGEAIRVWVPGSGTGESAYMMAMLFLEELRCTGRSLQLKIFATDANENALALARAGTYPKSVETHLPASQLRRFFSKEHRGYRINQEVRQPILFSSHDLTTDPPPSRLDMISCQNMLSHTTPEKRESMLWLFHHALRDDGVLVLGDSEWLETGDEWFGPLSSTYPAYRRSRKPAFPVRCGGEASGDLRMVWPHRWREPASDHRDFGDIARRFLLENYAPPSVLIDDKFECLSCFGRIDRYLRVSQAPKANLFSIAREGLRPKLHVALAYVCGRTEMRPLSDPGILEKNGFASLTIAVLPMHIRGENLFLVSFLDAQAHFDWWRGAQPSDEIIVGQPEGPPDSHRDSHRGLQGRKAIAGLSPRQRKVLDLLAEGQSNKQIAGDLGISQRTVESHRAIVMRKVGARSFADLIRIAATA